MAEKDNVFIGESVTKKNTTTSVKSPLKVNTENTKEKDKE